MSEQLANLTATDLRTLATALRSGRLALPLTSVSLRRLLPAQTIEGAAQVIESLAALGINAPQIAAALELIVADRAARALPEGAVDLVTTGPDGVGANRDTAVVVRELFANATKSVLVAGYAVYQGQHVFEALADRMQQLPTLHVSMFLDIQRSNGDTSPPAELVRRFAERFMHQQWPGGYRLPELFYDPRSLDLTLEKRACLHAKCVVVDNEKLLVSSANFTEAAQLRNIEVGVLLESAATANQVTTFFTGLVSNGSLVPIQLNDSFLYFAYGSNMFPARLRRQDRAPSANLVGVATLMGHKLTFDKESIDGSGKCDAEQTRSEKDSVHGVLFRIAEADRPRLNRAEGCGAGYEAKLVRVKCGDVEIQAWSYFATKKKKGIHPFHWYKAWVLEGAKLHGLPSDYLDRIEGVISVPDPDGQRAAIETNELARSLSDSLRSDRR